MRKKRRLPAKPKGVKLNYPRNERIRAERVLVIDSSSEEKLGEMPTREAIELARGKDLDLVLLSPNSNPPVAKILDWSKFKYSQNKKHKNAVRGRTKNKEWWFKPKIEDFDINIKLGKIKKFLEKGGTAKVTVRSQRRVGRDQMYDTMQKVINYSEEFAEKLSDISKEGRNISVMLKLKANKKENEEEQVKNT